MVYILFIKTKNNENPENSVLFTASNVTFGISKPFWVLPPDTNNDNYKNRIQKLIRDIFGSKRVVKYSGKPYLIKDYTWDKNIHELKKEGQSFSRDMLTRTIENKNFETALDIIDANVFEVNLFYYLEKPNATFIDKMRSFCKYHKSMVNSQIKPFKYYKYNENTGEYNVVEDNSALNKIARFLLSGGNKHKKKSYVKSIVKPRKSKSNNKKTRKTKK